MAASTGLRPGPIVVLNCYQIYPTHPLFRRFRAIASPGFMTLSRDAFNDLEEAMVTRHAGTATLA